ncbi:MAG: CPBP family intramembrane glutamic endopeptidase [Usitatibacter sp.]
MFHADMNPKRLLIEGAVKPWHVIFVFFVAWSVGIVGGFKMTQGVAGEFRLQAWDAAVQGIYSTILLAFVAVVPEFRRALGALFTKPRIAPTRNDLAIVFGLSLAWGYGMYMLAICLPILLAHPSAFAALRFTEALPRFEIKYLVAMLGSVLVAPIAEELFFRGYLLNLWIARRGIVFGVVASSIVFGAFHRQTALFAAPMGLLLALVYLRYDSLWPSILVHAAYNLLAFPWLLAGLFYVKSPDDPGHLSRWIPELVMSALFVPLLFLFWRRFNPSRAA